MKKIVLVLAMLGLAACNTAQGVKKDVGIGVEKTGEVLQKGGEAVGGAFRRGGEAMQKAVD